MSIENNKEVHKDVINGQATTAPTFSVKPKFVTVIFEVINNVLFSGTWMTTLSP